MPAKSKRQQRLFGAVEGGATFPLAKKIRAQMTSKQVRDFAATKRVNLPDSVKVHRPNRRTNGPRKVHKLGDLYG